MRFQNPLFLLLVGCGIQLIAAGDSGVVHEWGTFTSVTGEDGSAQLWRPLSGHSDLPCFVHHLDQRNQTPVLYFYPLKPMSISVHVGFPNGRVTEWFPDASSVQPATSKTGAIAWDRVQLTKADEQLPISSAASHYYAARNTDSWPLKSEGEKEKLLFYRGLGTFGVDLQPVLTPEGVSLRNFGSETIPEVIVFENHNGKIGYHAVHSLRQPVEVKFSALNGTMENLRIDFEGQLIEMGLYPKEAHAMLETWRDSWFEEGLRAFYILPRAKVDTLLPLSIAPAPSQLARVFVGRVELLSPEMRQQISWALSSGDVSVLRKYGRFLNAFLQEMANGDNNPPMCGTARQFLEQSDRQIDEEAQPVPCNGQSGR